jgi:uncharacterized protein YbdZ (MbtH family)
MTAEVTYHVVVNHEEQYSIWPTMRGAPPDGWRTVGKEGTEAECLDYIEKVWTDMRPLSLRREMEEAARAAPAKDDEFAEWPAGPSLVDRLAGGEHAISLVMRPEASVDGFWAAVNRGFINVLFPHTQGGTELTVALDPSHPPEEDHDRVHLAGRVTLDYQPITCLMTVDLRTFSGTGAVQRA